MAARPRESFTQKPAWSVSESSQMKTVLAEWLKAQQRIDCDRNQDASQSGEKEEGTIGANIPRPYMELLDRAVLAHGAVDRRRVRVSSHSQGGTISRADLALVQIALENITSSTWRRRC